MTKLNLFAEKFSTTDTIKTLSIDIKNALNKQGIEAKQSLILESIAHSLKLQDWNTLSALLNQSEKNLKIEPLWENKTYIHIDNGGYTFEYDKGNEILAVKTSFFGYTENKHFFHFNLKNLKEFAKNLNDFKEKIEKDNNQDDYESLKNFIRKQNPIINGKNIIHILENEIFSLELKNDATTLNLYGISDLKVAEKLLSFLNKVTTQKEIEAQFIYPLTDHLLESMAMRYDHSFGLLENQKEIEKYLLKMKNLYNLYKENLSNEEIVKKLNLSIITVKQLREEVTGEGFYKPKPIMKK